MRVLFSGSVAVAACLLAVALWGNQEKPGEAQSKPAGKPASAGVEPLKPVSVLAAAPSAPVDPKSYKLGAEDVVLVRVWREPDLSGPVVIRPDGQITLPLIGDVAAAGVTPVELSAKVAEKLSEYINRPEVIISVQSVRSKRYNVTGEVNRPGAYPLVVPTTVMEALTQAGGFREFANTKNVIVLRGSQRFKFNYKDFIKGKNLGQNITLESGDYIIVP